MTEKARCTARRTNGEPCGRYPTRGSRVCRSHGAGAPQVRRKANERVVEAELMKAAQNVTPTPVSDPLTALADFAGEVVTWKNLIAGRLDTLLTAEDGIRYQSPAGEQLRAEVALFERALDRVGTVLAAIARLNIDDRLAKISKEQGDRLDLLLTAVFADLALTPDQQSEGRESLARRIRALS